MHLSFKNVNDAFQGLVQGIHTGTIRTEVHPSRVGEVLCVEEPVIVTYKNPRERVLFNQARDANPFFHLYESLWMLAGRNDVAPLDYYASDYSKITSDDGRTANGAYGYRWRNGRGPQYVTSTYEDTNGTNNVFDNKYDQLKIIVDQLKRKPESRRVVLSMWNVRDDLLQIDTTKDVCCNTHAYFLVERGPCLTCEARNKCLFFAPPGPCSICGGPYGSVGQEAPRYLNMTVCNRSNDMIWGMLGANVVHFSFLQEYLAACIGLEVGSYHQITNNLHVYTERWEPTKWLEEYKPKMACADCRGGVSPKEYVVYGDCEKCGVKSTGLYPKCNEQSPYEGTMMRLSMIPLVRVPPVFDDECREFVERHSKDSISGGYTEPFLREVAQPMCGAFHHHKHRNYGDALIAIETVAADDWRLAGRNWITKRKLNWEKRYEQRSSTDAAAAS